MTVIVDTWTIQILRDPAATEHVQVVRLENVMAETEENVTLLLPDGYRVFIRRWDQGDEDE